MKLTKKLFSVLLAMVMVLAMAVPTMAESITITPKEGQESNHEYRIYQIFTGDIYYEEDDPEKPALTNICYGASYHPEGVEAGSKVPIDVVDEFTNAREDVRKLINSGEINLENPYKTIRLEEDKYSVEVEAGYYLIVDTINGKLAAGDAMSAYMVQVLDDEELSPKVELPKLGKTISDESGSTDELVNGDNHQTGAADELDIGDVVTYTLEGVISANANEYKVYYWNVNDTMSEGLTLNTAGGEASDSDFTITLHDDEGYSKKLTPGTDYNVKVTSPDGVTHISIALTPNDGWKEWAGKQVTITYSATLNDKAKVGTDPNTNTAILEYATNPEWDNSGEPESSLDNGRPAKDIEIPSGETKETKVETYTTELKVMKVDEEGNTLLGAEFKLEGEGLNILLKEVEDFKPATGEEEGEYWKLNTEAGNPERYTKVAPHTSEWMRPATDRNGGYVVDDAYNGEDVKEYENHKYRPATDEELKNKGINLFVLMQPNTKYYADVNQKYVKTVTYKAYNEAGQKVEYKAEVGADGTVTFRGLGAGTYTLTETKAPEGYNKIDKPIEVVVTWEYNKDTRTVKWSATRDGETIMTTDGTFSFEIENIRGNLLPETGGIGTTIFYVVGGILVVGAVILLVTKKRMSKEA